MTTSHQAPAEYVTGAAPAAVPEPREVPQLRVTGDTVGERLAQLASIYDAYKDAFDTAKEQFEQVQTAIKAELSALTHDVDQDGQTVRLPYERYELDLSSLRQPLALTFSMRTITDTKRLKAEHPEIVAEYAKTTGAWTLARKK